MTNSTPVESASPLLELRGIHKSFAGVPVLHGVDFDVRPGEVHALVGENGAGKSTLMKIASGVLEADSGSIVWEGREVRVRGPRHAHELGIRFVHQELMLVPQLSVAENIFLGQHPGKGGWLRWVGWKQMEQKGSAIMADLGHDIDQKTAVGELRLAEQQLVEIARALAFSAKLIIMDEPTAPLSGREVERLFRIIARLKNRGVGLVYISHRLKEIYEVADRVTVMRDGRKVSVRKTVETTPQLLVRDMVGRDIPEDLRAGAPPEHGVEALRVEGFTSPGRFRNVSFSVRRGEIVGFAGLVGAGRTELVESLFGAGSLESGDVFVEGRRVVIRTPEDAVRLRMALVADDRKAKGIVPMGSLHMNMALAARGKFTGLGGLLDLRRERRQAAQFREELRIRSTGLEQLVMSLSGGNQQKVVLARWLMAEAQIYILDEPTRGIDVGSKAEIYELIRTLAARGAAILLVSSELEEILRLADRVLVMQRGELVGELTRSEASEESIMRLATGAGLPA